MAFDLGALFGGGGGAFGGATNIIGSLMNMRRQRAQNSANRMEIGAAQNRAARSLSQTQDDAHLAERQGEESFAARGLGDSTIRDQGMARIKKRGLDAVTTASENVSIANARMKAFKKALEYQRQMNYMNLGSNMLGFGLGAYSMLPPSRPQTPLYTDQG